MFANQIHCNRDPNEVGAVPCWDFPRPVCGFSRLCDPCHTIVKLVLDEVDALTRARPFVDLLLMIAHAKKG